MLLFILIPFSSRSSSSSSLSLSLSLSLYSTDAKPSAEGLDEDDYAWGLVGQCNLCLTAGDIFLCTNIQQLFHLKAYSLSLSLSPPKLHQVRVSTVVPVS